MLIAPLALDYKMQQQLSKNLVRQKTTSTACGLTILAQISTS